MKSGTTELGAAAEDRRRGRAQQCTYTSMAFVNKPYLALLESH